MPIYRFSTNRINYYDVEAPNQEKALEKLEKDPLEYSADIYAEDPEFEFEDIVG